VRTLFIFITVIASWLGWNAHRVHQRESFLHSLRQLPDIDSEHPMLNIVAKSPNNLPYAWRLLGAKPVEDLLRRQTEFSDAELESLASQLLPDAVIIVMDPKKQEVRSLTREP
jgi:hypothetical protein